MAHHMKKSPQIVDDYALDIPVFSVRAKIRQEFEKNRYIKELKVIDILLFKGRTEYEETMNMWKQKSHVMRYFSEQEESRMPPESTDFLNKFYAGTA